MIDFDALFAQIQKRFNAQAAAGISGVFQFKLSDNQNFYCEIKDAHCSLAQAIHPSAGIQFELSANVLLAILSGEQDALQAFMEGSIIASGDLTLAPALVSLFGSAR